MKPDKVVAGIIAYAESEILPVLDGWRIWAGSFALELIRQRADVLLAAFVQDRSLAMLGLVDANGDVNVDAAIAALKDTARKHGKLTLDIPAAGRFALGEDDFDKLREYILRAA